MGPLFRFRPAFVADGKLYIENVEHNPREPQLRGAPFIAIDLETGEEVFRIDGLRGSEWSSIPIIADSIIVMFNSHDNQIYAIGKGPSAITVEVQPKTLSLESQVIIEGKVTDISAGTKDSRIAARFPNGVAVVADESMSKWMNYVYMQFPRPTDALGVEVTIDVIDANGNYRNIGTAVSVASGFYSLDWTPDISGKYTVIATFEGSKSYYPSFDQTAFVVDEAPEPTTGSTDSPQSVADAYFVTAVVGIILAIAIVGALIMLMLRKRP